MPMKTLSAMLALTTTLLFLPSIVTSFSRYTLPTSQRLRQQLRYDTKTFVIPPSPLEVSSLQDSLESVGSSIVLSKDVNMPETIKTVLIVLAFGGGLIPAAIAANGAMMTSLSGKRNEETYTKSESTGPTLPLSFLLFPPDKIPLTDIVAIVGRIQNLDSIADWRNLPSTKVPNAMNPEKPPMWLPRAMFKENIRNAPFGSWPMDAKTGKPVGGEALQREEERNVSSRDVVIGDAALDAVFDTWAWGASIATPDKVEDQLKSWRSDDSSFSLARFVGSAVRGRSITALGALTFVVIQVVAYGCLFIAPALRYFLDIDIGFGQLGSCSPEGCVKVFDFL